jgi:hypothetical protein
MEEAGREGGAGLVRRLEPRARGARDRGPNGRPRAPARPFLPNPAFPPFPSLFYCRHYLPQALAQTSSFEEALFRERQVGVRAGAGLPRSCAAKPQLAAVSHRRHCRDPPGPALGH